MTVVYFKSTAPEIINAMNEFKSKLAFISENADNFAKEYGEESVLMQSGLDTFFDGLKWNGTLSEFYDKYDKLFWTINRKNFVFSPKWKKGSKVREQWQELQKKHHLFEHETSRVSREIILKSLGTDFSGMAFSSFGGFYHDNVCYFGTNNISLLEKNINRIQEITGSEYEKYRKLNSTAKGENDE